MVIIEGTALLTGIKGTINIVKSLKSSYDAKTITQAQSDILEHLFALQIDALALQEKHFAIIHEKEELIKKVVQFEQWEKTESEYELQEIVSGTFVYTSKNTQQFGIPTHWLCTQCWDNRKKSILQRQYVGHTPKLICPRCKFSFNG